MKSRLTATINQNKMTLDRSLIQRIISISTRIDIGNPSRSLRTVSQVIVPRIKRIIACKIRAKAKTRSRYQRGRVRFIPTEEKTHRPQV